MPRTRYRYQQIIPDGQVNIGWQCQQDQVSSVQLTYEPVLIEGHFNPLTDLTEGIFYQKTTARAVE